MVFLHPLAVMPLMLGSVSTEFLAADSASLIAAVASTTPVIASESELLLAQSGGIPIRFAPGAVSWKERRTISANQTTRYSLEASAGQPANVRIYSRGQQVLLTIVSPSGEPIVRQQSGASSWSGTLPESGTYSIQATDVGRGEAYTLSVTVEPVNHPTPTHSAQLHHLGKINFAPGATSATVRHYIADRDIDQFTFDASAGQESSIYISSVGNRVLLSLTSPSGQPLARDASGASSWAGRLPESGTYTLKAIADGGADEYTLKLTINP